MLLHVMVNKVWFALGMYRSIDFTATCHDGQGVVCYGYVQKYRLNQGKQQDSFQEEMKFKIKF